MKKYIDSLKEERKEYIGFHEKSITNNNQTMILHYGSMIYTLNKVIELAEMVNEKK